MPTLPNPNDRKAPSFSAEEPENLPRFWEQMVDYFKIDKTDDADARMRTIVKYTKPEVDRQWRCFDTFGKGDWDAFEREVFSNYPRAQEIRQGSLERLERVCFKYRDVELSDYSKILEFLRGFKTEMTFVVGIKPELITNKGLVDLFLKTLDASVRSTVKQHLLIKIGKSAPPAGTTVRRPEDPYSIEDVMNTLRDLAELEKGAGVSLGSSTAPSFAPSVVKTEAVSTTNLQETIQGYFQESQRTFEKMMKKEMETFTSQLAQRSLPQQTAPQNYNYRQGGPPRDHVHRQQDNQRGQLADITCHFCWELGHMLNNCEHFLEFLTKGWIVRSPSGRGFQLPSGEVLPREINTSTAPRFRIEAYWAQKTRKQAIQVQLFIDDVEAEREGLIAMGPPPSSWYGHPTMDVYQQQMQTHSLRDNLIAGLHHELSNLRTEVAHLKSGPGPAQLASPSVPTLAASPSVHPTVTDTHKGGPQSVFTIDDMTKLLNAIHGQNVLTRTGVSSRPDEVPSDSDFQ